MLLNSVIRVLNLKLDVKGEIEEQISVSQKHNVKLQLEQITPVLCCLFYWKPPTETSSTTDTDLFELLDQVVNTYRAVLITLSTIAGKEDWVEIVCKQVIHIL